ncbi:TetR/AcrR family transcriptional regulator [Desulfothermus okinawensis JCM 13304]
MDKLSAKERIIEAAYNLFSEKGYHATSTKEIAKAAKVSEVTLFRNFGTKEGLFEEVLKERSIIPDLLKAIDEVEEANLEYLLFALSKKFYFTLLSKKKFIVIISSELNQYSDKIINIHRKLINEIDDLLVKIFSKYHCNGINCDLNTIAVAFRGMIFDFFFTNEIFLRRTLSREEIEKILSGFVTIILNSITKP